MAEKLMARNVKSPEERRLEIVLTAEKLFAQFGFRQTSIEAIITEMGVAKGTFYYYFKSKDEVLKAIVTHTLDQIVAQAQQVADAPSLDALSKMQILLAGGNVGDEDNSELVDRLHLPENRELHELSNVQSILRLSPIFAQIVEQGIAEKVFEVRSPLESVQFLLTGSQFLLDEGLFEFTPEEMAIKRQVAQGIIEQVLGAKPGSFGFMDKGGAK